MATEHETDRAAVWTGGSKTAPGAVRGAYAYYDPGEMSQGTSED